MTYRIHPEVLQRADDLVVYLVVANQLTNSESDEHDAHLLEQAEHAFAAAYGETEIRSLPAVAAYRRLFEVFGINPNRFAPSIEAMLKRIAKGGHLHLINQMVDRSNTVSIRTNVSLGAHDAADLLQDMALRLSVAGDRFLPLGSDTWEEMPPGELVFASGSEIQTRRGMWRQSEKGKSDLSTTKVYFHLVGFQAMEENLRQAVVQIEDLIQELGGTGQTYRLDASTPVVSWHAAPDLD